MRPPETKSFSKRKENAVGILFNRLYICLYHISNLGLCILIFESNLKVKNSDTIG